MGNTKEFSAQVLTKAPSGVRTITAIVTSNKADRDGDIVDVKSLRLPLKGGGYVLGKDLNGTQLLDLPFLLNHSFNVEDMIGAWQSGKYIADTDEIQLEAGVSTREKAQDLMKLFDEGFVGNNFSITMSDYTYDEPYIYDAEVVEVSFVFKGANREARLQMVKSLLKGENMADAKSLEKSLEDKKAELDALTKEIEQLEAADVEDDAVTAPEAPQAEVEPKVEAEPAEAVEAVVEPVQTPVETPAVEADAIEEVAEEIETNKEESKMSEIKDVVSKQIQDAPVLEGEIVEAKYDKVDLMAKQFSAWVNKDSAKLEELNKVALGTYKSKLTYMNTGVTADGGAIVPSNEFLTDVFTTLSDYSTIANDLRVITLDSGNGLDIASLLTDVVMTEVSTEGGSKSVTKPVLGDGDISVREFAGIAIVTKKLVRQAAVNVYEILRESFARAIATKRAELALTDATSGIINKATVTEVVTGAAMPTWAEVKSMPYKVTAGASQGGKYYISRELLESLDGYTVNGIDQELVRLDGTGLAGTFKNGYAFAVEEVLSGSGVHAVFGNAGRYGILLRQGIVENETFDSGIVVDGSSAEHNLLQENKLANRVAFYENVGWPIPSAFAVTTTGASS